MRALEANSAAALYAIADLGLLGAGKAPEAVRTMAAEGVSTIQLRGKRASGAELYRVIAASRESVPAGCRLWIDDRADLVALFPDLDLHLGQADLPPAAARRFLGPRSGSAGRIGWSTHDEPQLEAADADPAVDVIAVGPIFPTTGKENPDQVVGLGFLRWARRHTRKPLVAIGGIDAGNVASVLAAGADQAAVLGAVCRGDVGANCRRLLAACGST